MQKENRDRITENQKTSRHSLRQSIFCDKLTALISVAVSRGRLLSRGFSRGFLSSAQLLDNSSEDREREKESERERESSFRSVYLSRGYSESSPLRE